MYRVVTAGKYFDKGATKFTKQQVQRLMTNDKYQALYKSCLLLVDDEVTNQYGEVEVTYDPGDCTGTDNEDGTITIVNQIYADFNTEANREKHCYAEVTSIWDGTKITESHVTHFDDEVEYE